MCSTMNGSEKRQSKKGATTFLQMPFMECFERLIIATL